MSSKNKKITYEQALEQTNKNSKLVPKYISDRVLKIWGFEDGVIKNKDDSSKIST